MQLGLEGREVAPGRKVASNPSQPASEGSQPLMVRANSLENVQNSSEPLYGGEGPAGQAHSRDV